MDLTGARMPFLVCEQGHGVVSGIPADCAKLALEELAGAARHSPCRHQLRTNLGADVTHSGTVAAAAGLAGIPSIAV